MIQLLGIIVFALLLYLGQKYVYAKIWQRDLKESQTAAPYHVEGQIPD